MSEKPIREYDRFILRLPDGMRERVQDRAKINGRSMNAEIVAILTQVIDGPDALKVPELRKELARIEEEIDSHTSDLRVLAERHSAVASELYVRGVIQEARSVNQLMEEAARAAGFDPPTPHELNRGRD